MSCGEWFQTQMEKTFIPPTLSGIWSYLTGGFFPKKLDGKKFDGYTIFSPLKFLWNNAVEPVAEFVLSPFDKKATYKEEEVKEVKNPLKSDVKDTEKEANKKTVEQVALENEKPLVKMSRLIRSHAKEIKELARKENVEVRKCAAIAGVGEQVVKELVHKNRLEKEEERQRKKEEDRVSAIIKAERDRDKNLSHAAQVREETERGDTNTAGNAGNTGTGGGRQ